MKTIKHNTNKPQLSMLDPDFLEDMAKVMMFGAKKYSRNNWKLGLEHSAIVDAILRHTMKILRGEYIDDESGFPHLSHIACNAMFLHYYQKNEVGTDDIADLKNIRLGTDDLYKLTENIKESPREKPENILSEYSNLINNYLVRGVLSPNDFLRIQEIDALLIEHGYVNTVKQKERYFKDAAHNIEGDPYE